MNEGDRQELAMRKFNYRSRQTEEESPKGQKSYAPDSNRKFEGTFGIRQQGLVEKASKKGKEYEDN